MKPQDPSYPLFPVASIVCAASIALVLSTSFVRQSLNTGLLLLCVYLFVENLLVGVDAIIWADNSDVRLHVYCDIGGTFFT